MDTVIIREVSTLLVFVNVIAFLIASIFSCAMGITYLGIFVKTGNTFVRAKAFYFISVGILAGSNVLISVLYAMDRSTITIDRFFYLRGVLLAVTSVYMVYKLYKNNGKYEKVMSSTSQAENHITQV